MRRGLVARRDSWKEVVVGQRGSARTRTSPTPRDAVRFVDTSLTFRPRIERVERVERVDQVASVLKCVSAVIRFACFTPFQVDDAVGERPRVRRAPDRAARPRPTRRTRSRVEGRRGLCVRDARDVANRVLRHRAARPAEHAGQERQAKNAFSSAAADRAVADPLGAEDSGAAAADSRAPARAAGPSRRRTPGPPRVGAAERRTARVRGCREFGRARRRPRTRRRRARQPNFRRAIFPNEKGRRRRRARRSTPAARALDAVFFFARVRFATRDVYAFTFPPVHGRTRTGSWGASRRASGEPPSVSRWRRRPETLALRSRLARVALVVLRARAHSAAAGGRWATRRTRRTSASRSCPAKRGRDGRRSFAERAALSGALTENRLNRSRNSSEAPRPSPSRRGGSARARQRAAGAPAPARRARPSAHQPPQARALVPPRERQRRRETARRRRHQARHRGPGPVVSDGRRAFELSSGSTSPMCRPATCVGASSRQVAGELLGVPRAGARLEHIFGEAHHRCARGARHAARRSGRSPERAPTAALAARWNASASAGARRPRIGRDAGEPRDSLGDGRHRRRVFSRRRRRDGGRRLRLPSPRAARVSTRRGAWRRAASRAGCHRTRSMARYAPRWSCRSHGLG